MKTLAFESGARMPALGLGTWQSDPGVVGKIVGAAIERGYRHIDCARIYENENEIGEALDVAMEARGVARDDLWITSKLWNNAHRKQDVRPALEKALKDLRLEYLDLYLMHWPVAVNPGVLRPRDTSDLVALEDCPITETWGAMEELVDAGLCRHLGVSNFSPVKLRGLVSAARIKPVMNQVEMHPYLQQPGLLEVADELGVHLTAYSPIGSPNRPEGLKHDDEPILLEDETIAAIATAHDATPAQVLLAWGIQRGTAVIPKTTKEKRLDENLAAAGLELTEDEMASIAALDRHHRYIDGAFWTGEGSPYTLANIWDE